MSRLTRVFFSAALLGATGLATPAVAGGLTVPPAERVTLISVPGGAADSRSPRTSDAPREIPLLQPPLRQGTDFDGARPFGFRSPFEAPTGADPSPQAAVVGTLNQPGLSATTRSPPDATGAIGPSHYVEMVNSTVGVYRRSDLGLVGSQTLDVFTGFTGRNVFDPQVQWDEQAGRWFYVTDAIDQAPDPDQHYLAFGFSRTADPSDLTNGWCRYSIPTGNEFDDYPKLGHSDNFVIIGTNVFTNAFQTARIWTITKPPAGDVSTCPPGSSFTATSFGSASSPLTTPDGQKAFTPVPANTANPSPDGYVVAADHTFTTENDVIAWNVTSGPGGSAVLTRLGEIPVTPYTFPSDAPQPPPHDTVDTVGFRFTQAAANADPDAGGATAVWVQHTVDADGVGGTDGFGTGPTAVRWYELLPGLCSNNNCPASARRQEGEIEDATHWVFNGAISPTRDGNQALINYNLSSATQLPQIRARSRLSATPLGQMTGEITLGTSDAADQDFTCNTASPTVSCRWGDYAGASPDMAANCVAWGSNQLSGPAPATPGNPHWTTRNFALTSATTGNPCAQASFTFSPASPETGQTVTFTSTSSDPEGQAITHAWDLDNDNVYGEAEEGSGTTASRSFPTVGAHPVKLRVTDASGNESFATRFVNARNRPPTAAFNVSPASPQTGQTVTFTSTSSDPEGQAITQAWDLDNDGNFGESGEGTGTSASRSFATAGDYTIRLRVTDNNGAEAVATQTVTVRNRPPTASFSFSPASPETGQTVTFTSTSSDPDGTITQAWDLDNDGNFGETGEGTGTSASRSFPTAGDYTIRLRVTDNNGAQVVATQTFAVRNRGPVAALTGPTAAETGQTVVFDGSGSSDPDGTIAKYEWDLDGNGSFERDTGTAATTSETYRAPGTVTVRLRVTDNNGGQGQANQTITISEPPAGPTPPGPTPPGPTPPIPDRLRPLLTSLRLVPSAFPAALRGPSVVRTRIGTEVRYGLSEPATTTFTVERARPGRRSGRRCIPLRRPLRRIRRCTLYSRVRGSIRLTGATGANRFRFSGRLGGRTLAPGSYRLVGVPVDLAGNRGSARRAGFRITPPRRRR